MSHLVHLFAVYVHIFLGTNQSPNHETSIPTYIVKQQPGDVNNGYTGSNNPVVRTWMMMQLDERKNERISFADLTFFFVFREKFTSNPANVKN